MRSLVSLVFASAAIASPALTFHVIGGPPGSWPTVLSSIGLEESAAGDVLIVPSGAKGSLEECQSRVNQGAFLILEGESSIAESFGFHATRKPRIIVRSVEDPQPSGRG